MTMNDPVCGMEVEPPSATAKEEFEGQTYFFFCSEPCHRHFVEAPARYADRSVPAQAESHSSVYTCPMHPDVRRDGPGDCPDCGMSLEPVTVPNGPQRTRFTCPMHPEIVSDEPGRRAGWRAWNRTKDDGGRHACQRRNDDEGRFSIA